MFLEIRDIDREFLYLLMRFLQLIDYYEMFGIVKIIKVFK